MSTIDRRPSLRIIVAAPHQVIVAPTPVECRLAELEAEVQRLRAERDAALAALDHCEEFFGVGKYSRERIGAELAPRG